MKRRPNALQLFNWLEQTFALPGATAMAFISTRTGLAAVTSLLISLFIGKRIIAWLLRMQLGEVVRDDIGLDHQSKQGTNGRNYFIVNPIPSLLFVRMDSIYGWLIFFVMLTLGLVGFIDDYIKVVKKNKSGLAGRFKIAGQVGVGLVLGLVLYSHPNFETAIPKHGTFAKNLTIDYAYFGETWDGLFT